MKWFQAHLRVMSRSDSAEDQAHFLELVLNKEIREHCHHLFYTQPNYKQCDRRSFNVVLQFHYDVVAGLTLFKVVAPFAKSNFVKANVSTTFPVSFYKALFEPSGKIKDDVLMAAFNNKSYVRSPHQFVVEFLVYRRNSYLFDSDCTIKTLKHDIRMPAIVCLAIILVRKKKQPSLKMRKAIVLKSQVTYKRLIISRSIVGLITALACSKLLIC